jgi:HEPN domain-containing protein
MRKEAEHWAASAAYDWATAQDLLAAHRYSFAVFCAHQAVENLMKAAVIESTEQFPPLTHNLVELARRLATPPPPAVSTALKRLAPHYTATRHPDVLGGPPHEAYNADIAREMLRSAEEAMKWLRSLLPSSGTSTS